MDSKKIPSDEKVSNNLTILQLEKERLGTTESRSPSPGIRFEEEQVKSQYFLSSNQYFLSAPIFQTSLGLLTISRLQQSQNPTL